VGEGVFVFEFARGEREDKGGVKVLSSRGWVREKTRGE
jgi:hypothetical protein